MKDRRTFLKILAATTAGIMVPFRSINGSFIAPSDRLGDILPLRVLGRTNEKVTMLGLGGAHVGKMKNKLAQKVIEAAIEGGIRFFDNAPGYSDGGAETKYGKYLVPKYRDVSFIMTKSPARDKKRALEQLDESLDRMKTDYVDLWQLHSIKSVEDANNKINNGLLEALLEAKEKGKARHIGFTGHQDFRGHQEILKKTDIMETCQMPINCFDPNYKSYIKNVLPELVERNMGVLAMKTLSNGGFFGGTQQMHSGDKPRIVPGAASIQEALHFVWSLPVSVLITGAHDVEMLNEKIDLAKSFVPMSESAREELVQRLADAGFKGEYVEFYKK